MAANNGIPSFYTMPNRFPSGARCRVCSTIYGPDVLPGVGFCLAHTTWPINSEEARLGKAAVRLQEFFGYGCKVYRERQGWAPAETYCRGVSLRSESEKQWWKWVVLFHHMCEYSHVKLIWWLLAWRDGRHMAEYDVQVRSVMKIRFPAIAPCGQRIWHCAFLLLLRSGAWYVFDPTGVQFGPEWALISPTSVYAAARMHHLDIPSQVQITDFPDVINYPPNFF